MFATRAFCVLAALLSRDYWTLNEFRQRHPRGLNDVFTLVVEAARELGMGKLGRVAIDSTRIEANASPDRSVAPRTGPHPATHSALATSLLA